MFWHSPATDGLDTRRVSNTDRLDRALCRADRRCLPRRRQPARRCLQYRRRPRDLRFGPAARRPKHAILPRFTADLELAAGRRDRRAGSIRSSRWSASTWRPTFGNTFNKIPNEDSTDFEFDETNLFEPSRFPGLDRVDTGSKVAYGLRFSNLGPRATELSGSFGQSYSLQDDSFIPADSGLQDNLSDYVGALYARPGPWLDLSYRFRLGKSDLQFRRSDALASFGPAFLRFNLGYLNLSQGAGGVRFDHQ